MLVALKEEEREALLELLGEALRNLREEVYKTENFDYREELKHREEILRTLLAHLEQAALQ
jgi:hypothetical protein